LDNLAAAKCEAVKMMGRLICDASETFWDCADWTMTVTDEAGLTVFELSVSGTQAPVAQPAAA
jgi:hypothetical protein